MSELPEPVAEVESWPDDSRKRAISPLVEWASLPEGTKLYSAEQVRQILAAEREANALKCDAEVARLTEQGEPRAAIVAGICAAAIRGG